MSKLKIYFARDTIKKINAGTETGLRALASEEFPPERPSGRSGDVYPPRALGDARVCGAHALGPPGGGALEGLRVLFQSGSGIASSPAPPQMQLPAPIPHSFDSLYEVGVRLRPPHREKVTQATGTRRPGASLTHRQRGCPHLRSRSQSPYWPLFLLNSLDDAQLQVLLRAAQLPTFGWVPSSRFDCASIHLIQRRLCRAGKGRCMQNDEASPPRAGVWILGQLGTSSDSCPYLEEKALASAALPQPA